MKTSIDSNKNEEINDFSVVKAPLLENSVTMKNKNRTKSLDLRHVPNLEKQGKIKTLFFCLEKYLFLNGNRYKTA